MTERTDRQALLADELRGRYPSQVVHVAGHRANGIDVSVTTWGSEQAHLSPPGLVRRLVLEDVGLPRPRPAAPPQRPVGELDFDWAVVEQVRPET